jgi:hypothetical protein
MKKVLRVTMHITGLLSKKTVDAKANKADMYADDEGVWIASIDGKPLMLYGEEVEHLVPFNNCTEVIRQSVDPEKPKLGRPPGPKAA